MSASDFIEKTRHACSDTGLAAKLTEATERQQKARETICRELGEVEAFRDLAAALRDEVLKDLDRVLADFVSRAEQSGVKVHWAGDGQEACEQITRIAQDCGVKRIVKSKSMITEEIALNPHLEKNDLEVVETDLGEFIIQEAGQRPSHIVLPAVHLSASDVRELFEERLDYEGPAAPEALTRAARTHLRDKFKHAQMGISGVNFALAEQGLWAVCTNEGNGRYVTGMPDVYVAVMGLERILKNAQGAAVILKMLGRFATGQRITQYVNLMGGPDHGEGPSKIHLVILDNGRSRILGTRYWPILRCIRCGACLNTCPVFKRVGGQSFPGCYSGPMGSVLLPLQQGLEQAGSTAKACSLCRACDAVCPVRIPLASLLTDLRFDLAESGRTPIQERVFMALGAWVLQEPWRYRLARKLIFKGCSPLSKDGWVQRLPGWIGQWTQAKDLQLPAREGYLERLRREQREQAGRKRNG